MVVLVEKKYEYDRFNSKGARVGQAVTDILSKEQPEYTVEEILDEFGKDWLKMIQDLASEATPQYGPKFYILSLLKKDLGHFGVANVLKHSARPFKTKMSIHQVMDAHPNATKTLFYVDSSGGEINLLWTVPGWEECKSIGKNASQYDPQLVSWVKEALQNCA